jgi:isocitrate dehydrogenase
MFEAIHGSAPRRAGQNLANPSGLLLGAVQMLVHIDQPDVAANVHNAWLKTLEDGIHTYDIYKEGISKEKVGTKEFAQAVISNLGKKPTLLKEVSYAKEGVLNLPKYIKKPAAKKELVGVDIFVHWNGTNPNELAENIQKLNNDNVKLSMITNRGIKVWPDGFSETFCTDHWRCRFKPSTNGVLEKKEILRLLNDAMIENIDTIKTENLYNFNEKPAYSLGQGQ